MVDRFGAPLPTGMLAMRRRAVLRHHQCNAWCMVGRHAELFFVAGHKDTADAQTRLAGWCGQMGLDYIAARPAPEAPFEPDPRKTFDPDGKLRPDATPAQLETFTPWLVVFAVPSQRQRRKAS